MTTPDAEAPRAGSCGLFARGAPVGPVDAGDRGRPDLVERERIRATLGVALVDARGAAGLSQRRLAALAGVHPRSIERLEAGQRRPTSALLAALAHALVVPPGWAANRVRVGELRARLEAAAGPSLVASTAGGERRRRRRMRKARRAANRAAVPVIRAGLAARREQLGRALADAQALAVEARRLLR